MKNTKLSFEVVFSPAEEGGYDVSVPALPGCFTQGSSLKEAKKNAKEAIQCYIESLQKEDEPLPNLKRVKKVKTLEVEVTVPFSPKVACA